MSHKLDNFAAFILTHGRPNDIYTYRSLQEAGYTGKIYFVIDNEDKTEDEYRRLFGSENVIQFDKAAIGETFDIADTRTDRRAIVYARNAGLVHRHIQSHWRLSLSIPEPSLLSKCGCQRGYAPLISGR